MPRCYASTHMDTPKLWYSTYGVLPIIFIHIHTRRPAWSSVHARLLFYYHQLPQVYYMPAEVFYICHIPINLFMTSVLTAKYPSNPAVWCCGNVTCCEWGVANNLWLQLWRKLIKTYMASHARSLNIAMWESVSNTLLFPTALHHSN